MSMKGRRQAPQQQLIRFLGILTKFKVPSIGNMKARLWMNAVDGWRRNNDKEIDNIYKIYIILIITNKDVQDGKRKKRK